LQELTLRFISAFSTTILSYSKSSLLVWLSTIPVIPVYQVPQCTLTHTTVKKSGMSCDQEIEQSFNYEEQKNFLTVISLHMWEIAQTMRENGESNSPMAVVQNKTKGKLK